MAEDYRLGFGSNHDDYDDEYEDDVASDDDGGQDDYRNEEAVDTLTDGSVDDSQLLTGATGEPVSYVPEEPTGAVESASDERLGHINRSWRGQARARREGSWIPPDLRAYVPPVFCPVGDQDKSHERARSAHMTPWEVELKILRQVRMQPLVSCSEVARHQQLEVAVVEADARALQRQGKLKGVKFGCLMPPTARYWEARESIDFGKLDSIDRDALSCHRDYAIESLLKYDAPKVDSINQLAVRYATGGWGLKRLAWVEEEAVQAVAVYQRGDGGSEQGLVYFVWLPLWASDREVNERLEALHAAVFLITRPGLSGPVVLVGPDRWAVAEALPLAVHCPKARRVKPANIAAWTYSGGWQAASGTSMLNSAAQPFRPTLSATAVDRFAWPVSLRRLGREILETLIENCP